MVAAEVRSQILIKSEDVAEMVGGCTVRHLQNLVKRKLMPAPIKIGGMVRFRKQDIVDWIEAGCPAVSEPTSESPGIAK